MSEYFKREHARIENHECRRILSCCFSPPLNYEVTFRLVAGYHLYVKKFCLQTSPGADMPNIHVGQSLHLFTFIVRY